VQTVARAGGGLASYAHWSPGLSFASPDPLVAIGWQVQGLVLGNTAVETVPVVLADETNISYDMVEPVQDG